jgi:uncharacterized protein YoxC
MCTTPTISKVRNYQGTNSFVIKMKESLNKWGNLTPKQIEAVEKCMNSEVKVDVENLNEELQKIAKYEGENNFVKDIKEKLLKYGTLTQAQVSASLKQIQKKVHELTKNKLASAEERKRKDT